MNEHLDTPTDAGATTSIPAAAQAEPSAPAPVQSRDWQATVRMPSVTVMAERMGLPGTRSARSGAQDGLVSTAAPAGMEQALTGPRVDVVVQNDGTGDVLLDGTPVATGANVADTYAAIIALVLDTARRAGRPVQMSVVSADGARRTLVAPDGSVRALGADPRGTAERAPSGAAPGAAAHGPATVGTGGASTQVQGQAAAGPQAVAALPRPAGLPSTVDDDTAHIAPAPIRPAALPGGSLATRSSDRLEVLRTRRQRGPDTMGAPKVVPVVGPRPGPVMMPTPADLPTVAAAVPTTLAPAPVDPPVSLQRPPGPGPAPSAAVSAGSVAHSGTQAQSGGAGTIDLVPPTGPAHPQWGVVPPAVGLPVRRFQPVPLLVLGAHGGAGESTLAALVPGWYAADHAWPAAHQPVVLVARTSLVGLTAARTAATQWASGQVQPAGLVGLVLVADAPGRLPKPLRDLVKVVSGGVPRVWHVPWVEAWRTDPPQLSETPKEVRRLVRQLCALTQPGATGA